MGGITKAIGAVAIAIAIALVSTAASASAAESRDLAGGASFGAQIDPFTTPAFCDRLREDGSVAASVFLTRGLIERNNGTLNTTAIDNRIEPGRACGIQLGVRVRPTTSSDQDSFLPSGAELDEYLSLLTQLAQYLDGRVRSYAIDNEAASQAHFDGTADDYFELLRRSAAALRAGDPDAEILDGTMASGSMTAVMVTDLYDQGRYGEAITLAQETQANELGGGAPVTDMASLTAYVNDSRVKRAVAFFAGAVSNQPYYDAFQLHYYGPWRGLPKMYEYVRSHGIALPIETWEVAHRYKDGRPFTEDDFAAETARLLVTAAGEGSAFTVFSSFLGNGDNNAVGLFDWDGTTPHLARSSFRTVGAQLTGATSATRLDVGGDAWGYVFQRPRGPVAAAWADPGPARIGGELGIDASTALVTAAAGSPQHVRLAPLEVGPTPIFAEPDLVELERRGKRSRKKLALLELSAREPDLGLQGQGEGDARYSKTVRRKKAKRPQVLGKERFKVARGESETVRVRFEKHGVAGQAIARTKPCTVRGRGGCESWLALR